MLGEMVMCAICVEDGGVVLTSIVARDIVRLTNNMKRLKIIGGEALWSIGCYIYHF